MKQYFMVKGFVWNVIGLISIYTLVLEILSIPQLHNQNYTLKHHFCSPVRKLAFFFFFGCTGSSLLCVHFSLQWLLWCWGSVLVVHRLSCATVCAIFLDQGWKQCSLHCLFVHIFCLFGPTCMPCNGRTGILEPQPSSPPEKPPRFTSTSSFDIWINPVT